MNVTQNNTIPKWTVLLYSAADNNLTSFMVNDVKEIEAVGTDSYTNMVAQVDQGGSIGAARYLLEKNDPSATEGIASPALETMGDVDMADPKMLSDFIKWGMDKYPAEHYALIISDHGGGWAGAVSDDSHGSWMTLPTIRQSLDDAQATTGRKLDVIGFDACLMGSTEVMKELSGNADYVVGSQQNEGGNGWTYTSLLTPELFKNLQASQFMKINVEPRQLATMIVRSAENNQGDLPTMTAVDTAKMDGLTKAVDTLGAALAETSMPKQDIKNIIYGTESFGGFKDLGHFSSQIAGSTKDANLKAAAEGVKAAMDEAIVATEHSDEYPNATGLHIELSTYGVPNGYNDLKLAQETRWPAALEKLEK